MESDENNFVILSRKLRNEGDTAHAERLLKSGLKRVESSLHGHELALLEILQELVSIYREQGRLEEHDLLSKRIDQIADLDIFNNNSREAIEDDTA